MAEVEYQLTQMILCRKSLARAVRTALSSGTLGRGVIARACHTLCFGALLFVILVLQTGCALIEQVRCVPHNAHNEEKQSSYREEELAACLGKNPVAHGGVRHSVFCFGTDHSRPPVVLLHELPGLSAKTLQYAESLSTDFTVYVPMLFGTVNQESTSRGILAFWFNREWNGSELDGNAPIVQWLRNMMNQIEKRHPNQDIGVIGNCLTGSLPLLLLDNMNVKAIVLAQPTLPIPIFYYSDDDRRSLGVSKSELNNAKNNAMDRDAKIYGVRFENDCVSRPEKREVLMKEFGGRYIDAQVRESEYMTPEQCATQDCAKAHSILIGEWNAGKKCSPSEVRRKEVREFLKSPSTFTPGSLPTCTESDH